MLAICTTPFDAAAPLPEIAARAPENLFSQVAVKHRSGFVSLNIDELQAGDILLFQGQSKASRAVWLCQRALFDAMTAAWTHCAIIDRNFSVWDAMPSCDVRCRSLGDVLRQRETITAVRPVIRVDHEHLSYALVNFSAGSYRAFRVETGGRLLARIVRSSVPPRIDPTDQDTICSLFVSDVLRYTTLHGFFANIPLALPADFLTDQAFGPLSLRWTAIEI